MRRLVRHRRARNCLQVGERVPCHRQCDMSQETAGKETESGSWIERARRRLSSRYGASIERLEERLASETSDRVVREFEWGLEWTRSWPREIRDESNHCDPETQLKRLNEAAIKGSSAFFAYKTPSDFQCTDNQLLFTSSVVTPYPENNTVLAQWFPSSRNHRRAVLVLPHWNADIDQHVSLCRLLSTLGVPALRLSLPYHDMRMPKELHRADYAVSSNLGRTIDAARQAVIDSRSCIDWLQSQGYADLGIVGTSLGSCYAFLASAHDERLRVNAYNLFSLHFADAVWTGITTRHIRRGMDGRIELDPLRECWESISPFSYLDRYQGFSKKSLFISGSYDTTFLPKYSKEMIKQIRLRKIDHQLAVLPCGHYTLGRTPFKYIDAYKICSFFLRNL
jgi:hypothetical protein